MRIPLCPPLRALSLPLTLSVCGAAVLSVAAVSPAQAEHSHRGHLPSGYVARGHAPNGQFGHGSDLCTQLGRLWGIGWGDGYHACRPRPEGRAADRPPATFYASPYAAAVPSVYDPEYARLPWLIHPSR